MRAKVGDRIILAGEQVDRPTRDGEVLEVRGQNGAPPYLVKWSDGHTGLLYPGPGSVLRVTPSDVDVTMPAATSEEQQGTVRQWQVRVAIFEAGDDTTATVALLADSPGELTARGTTHRSKRDRGDSHIGDEIAVARALRHLADDLLS
ncbi:MAG: DUF1918 domain-containing protein, partial [Actinomycetota bacterium]|nr:DUF1918 domain-containing protein [Actinomycetota bacterium]